ncbi:uncharacterized protein LOC111354294 [Spodoptera litura]|uniref:Uncharacterized protein LOC111354294 n=1 Tax=Spodoptera litura TaxID=69820 RepID=A0A9J7E6Z4_SPOLT|nr:uncharacterized protein LOC111354294 [Spodoptera litura]
MFKMFKYLLLLFIQCLFFNIGEVNSQDMLKDNLLGAMINELYLLYKDAYENEKTYVTRRFFTNHNHYTLHVQKLKEVNGWKTHNLKVESNVPWGKPVVYINNPVECHMPNAFFSREQFQKIMLSRIEEQKKRFSKDNIDLIKANKYFETHTPLPSNINVNAHQVIDKIKDEIIDALDSQITRNSEAINTRTTEELIITTVSNKNEAQEILRDMSPYTYKNTVKKSTKTIPGFKMTKEMKLTAKMRRTHPRNENTKSKTTKSNILTRSHLASNKKIKRKVATTTNPISKFVPIPDENKSVEEISTNIMTNSKEIIEKSSVRDFPSTAPLTSTEPTIDVTTEAVVSSTKVIADETTKETTTREPEVTITKTETTKNTDIDVTVHYTESTATITSTDSTTDATTKTVVSDTTATTETTQSTKRRTRQRRPYVFFNN